ncbi:MAG: hypothetical protein HKP61_16265 [Dactylosporangium sp.]|nr:class A beta-lactamase-related serine hydrolase [Dactylosporangium sp.]NNJ62461.1 hypothetical protein [Dactylosporangium sp.]
MRTKLMVTYGATAAVVLVAAAFGLALRLYSDGSGSPWAPEAAKAGSQLMMATQPAPPKPASLLDPLRADTVTVTSSGFWSWSLLERGTGSIVGSENLSTTQRTASMIKAWLAADYLRLAAAKGQTPSSATLKQLSIMIRDSDNNAASTTYTTLGQTESITRLISICGLTDSEPGRTWSHTMISARDAVRMGECIADGRGAGPAWTDWLLNEMRSVRGSGRFGPIEVLPTAEAKQTAIKNGWVSLSDGKWHINCLAVAPTWVLAVEAVYPTASGMAHGTSICRSVTQQLITPT